VLRACSLAEIGEEQRVCAIFAEHHPQVVIHAAAHKHMPMMELNPSEAIKNNVLGPRQLAEHAGQACVEAFVLISTDKALRPTSVMGASKRVVGCDQRIWSAATRHVLPPFVSATCSDLRAGSSQRFASRFAGAGR
jgi:FlaA1/EpsC-like NDP-sugar epimerase